MGNTRNTAAKTAKTNALPEVFKSLAPIANRYGNIITRKNDFDENVIVVVNLAPNAETRSLVPCKIRSKVLKSKFINDDVVRREFCIDLGRKIKGNASRMELVQVGVDALLPFAYVGAEFKLCKEGDEYITASGEAKVYTKTHYELDEESIKFFFKEHQEFIEKKDFEHFIKRSSEENFEITSF